MRENLEQAGLNQSQLEAALVGLNEMKRDEKVDQTLEYDVPALPLRPSGSVDTHAAGGMAHESERIGAGMGH